MRNNRKHISIYSFAPTIGALLFLCLYLVAAFYYPGGSQFDQHATGFSWLHNYWCNLLNEHAINGEPNPARPIAMLAMFILCGTLTIFWWEFPASVALGRRYRYLMRIFGTLAMAFGFLLLTEMDHDLLTNLASFCGLIAMGGAFAGLYHRKWNWLFKFGIVNVFLVMLNNVLYHSPGLIRYLPLVQKITFLGFLVWICCVNLRVQRFRKAAEIGVSFSDVPGRPSPEKV